MKTALEWFAAEAAVKKIKEEYDQLADWNYEGKVSRIASAKAIARKFGADNSLFLHNQAPDMYLGALIRYLGKGAVNAVE